jgi:aminoglycoside phosphotransferase (APT) family kinase protein
MHENQLTVTAAIVRSLVDGQFPEWVPLPITAIHSEGTVNAIFRIGDRIGGSPPARTA